MGELRIIRGHCGGLAAGGEMVRRGRHLSREDQRSLRRVSLLGSRGSCIHVVWSDGGGAGPCLDESLRGHLPPREKEKRGQLHFANEQLPFSRLSPSEQPQRILALLLRL